MVAYRGILLLRARSEIAAPFPEFFPPKIQNGWPKTNLGHFQKWKAKNKTKTKTKQKQNKKESSFHFDTSTKFYIHISILNFSMISDKYVQNGWSIIFFLLGPFLRPLKWRLGHVPPLPLLRYVTATRPCFSTFKGHWTSIISVFFLCLIL